MRIFCILLFTLLCNQIPAQRKQVLTASVLWEIKDAKTNKTSYLLGSIHTLRADSVFYKFRKLLDLLQSSRLFVCEGLGLADSTEAKKFKAAFAQLPKKTSKQWFGKDGPLIDSFFSTVFKNKTPMTKMLDDDPDLITQVSDIGDMSNAVMDTILRRSGLHPHTTPNFDETIANTVNEAGQPILQLDDAAFLSKNVFADASFAKDVAKCIDLFKKLETNDTSDLKNNEYYSVVRRMKQYYATATFDFLLKDRINNKAHIERNKSWVPKLVPELQEGNVFIVVGAAHLFMGGHYGLVPELRKRGFMVTPVELAPVNQ